MRGRACAGEARVDWTLPPHVVDRRIRGCTPAPGAWTTLRGERLKLGPAVPVDGELAPGVLQVGKAVVLVGTATRPLRLGLVQAPGKKPMPAPDWARGASLPAGTALGT